MSPSRDDRHPATRPCRRTLDRETTTTRPAPIACTLDATSDADRLAWITALNRTSLRSHALDSGRLDLWYAPAAAGQLRTLVQQERACCAFLAVEITETPDAIRLGILVPPAAGDSATELAAPFLAGVETTEATTATTANDDTGCGCSPQPRHAMQTSPRPVAPSERPHPASGDRAAGIAAGASAAAAVACGVCCVLPFAFPAVALTVVGGVFAAFAGVYR